jgi:hypothetical protein
MFDPDDNRGCDYPDETVPAPSAEASAQTIARLRLALFGCAVLIVGLLIDVAQR